jgi:uncharacterized protein (DUF362 family)
MKDHIDRRKFMKQSLAISTGAALGSFSLSSLLLGNLSNTKIDVSIVNGTDYFDNTMKAVELLGGIVKFVPKGSVVGLLVNSPWDRLGTCTNPDISLSVLKMCIDAGAKEIFSVEGASTSYWKRSKLYDKYESEIDEVKTKNGKSSVIIDKGKSLKQAEISKGLLDCDVLINIPIAKHHRGTEFTGNLKNMMGACSSSTNRFFHNGGGSSGYGNIEFLSQCIADVNLIRKPDLCIADATQFITTNGPAGPGKIMKADKIVAGSNCLSVDAYCATLLRLNPTDVLMLRYAYEHGLGEIDLKKLAINET